MREYNLSISGNSYIVSLIKVTDEEVVAEVNGVEHTVTINEIKTLSPAEYMPHCETQPSSMVTPIQPGQSPVSPSPVAVVGNGLISSPIPGHILELCVSVGEKVLEGQKILVLEAMKLENIITAHRAGVVKKILVRQGDAVTHGQGMVEIG
ncbi:MAG: acetyl-CoA carboxylase biotin carboxyl carrier protein subunit [Proteobacteria bacterium]|nr:acetyl-CoA carboxylase biotin carboxyl carrier protein subunit [Pseudomonadota bacterium]MBU1639225.1 acetyl-CoA carboxylase biotin carboxyl carrier protein subunit [Pseudomonadota bacterium]